MDLPCPIRSFIISDLQHRSASVCSYGYPDDNYLQRVLKELGNKALLTVSDLTEVQQRFIRNPRPFLPANPHHDFSGHFAPGL